MKKTLIKSLLLCTLIFNASLLQAKVPVVDAVLGEAIDKALYLAGVSSIPQLAKFRLINDQKSVARVKSILNSLNAFSGHKFRYTNPAIRIIAGSPDNPNAYSLGPSIYITQDVLKLLNDSELTAVLAHEISHSEYGHLTARAVYAVGSPVLFFRDLIFSSVYHLTTGEVDDFMERMLRDGQMRIIQEILEGASLRQEMQADCSAANWLARGHKKGFKVEPLDLNRATNKIMGVDIGSISKIDPENPAVIRYEAVRSGHYIGSGCPL